MDKYFNTRFSYDKRREIVWKVICKFLERYIDINDVVVDIGAGYCDFINNIKAKEKYAVDLYDDFRYYANSDIKTFVGDCTNLYFFEANFFDVFFSSNLLEHLTLQQIMQTLKEFNRVLKQNGKLILLLPNFKYCYKKFYDDYTHITPLTEYSICDILKTQGFEILRVFPKFLPFSLKSKFPVSTFLVKLYLVLPIKLFAGQMLIIAKKMGNKNVER